VGVCGFNEVSHSSIERFLMRDDNLVRQPAPTLLVTGLTAYQR
jgi:hypothetical protein